MPRTQQENKFITPVVKPKTDEEKKRELESYDYSTASMADLALLDRIEKLEAAVSGLKTQPAASENKPE